MTFFKYRVFRICFIVAASGWLLPVGRSQAAFTLTGTAAELVSRGINADFEAPAQTRGDGENTSTNNIGTGWTANLISGVLSNYGVQDPAIAFYNQPAGSPPLTAPFNGQQLGFFNLNNWYSQAEIVSNPIGKLQASQSYTLNVAVGARNVTNQNKVAYRIGLRAADGVDLGTFSVATIVPGASPTNISDLLYTLNTSAIPAQYIGSPVRIVIGGFNTGLNSTDVATDQLAQPNFDNVRLSGTFDDAITLAASLSINRSTGSITLTNTGGANLSVVGYSLTSAAGAFNPNAWTKFGAPLSQASANGSTTDLSEVDLSNTGTVVTTSTPRNLGSAWVRTPYQDVLGQVLLVDGTKLSVPVTYDGTALASGDLNADGSINGLDWTAFKTGAGVNFTGQTKVQSYAKGDLNGDLIHDLADFQLFRAAYDANNGAGSFAELIGVPEPTIATLMMIGGLFMFAFVRRRGISTSFLDYGQIWATAPRACLFLFAVAALYASGSARAQTVLYHENFQNAPTLQPNTFTLQATYPTVGSNVYASYVDTSAANRNRFVNIQTYSDPVMTFAFDTKEIATATGGADNELVFRAGPGTGNNTLGSAEFVIEAIAWRTSGGTGGNRGSFVNNGNESIFVVTNNQASSLNFNSPIDGTPVTLNANQYIPYVKNNDTGVWGTLKGISNFASPAGGQVFNRFGIGSSSSGHMGTMGIDNVTVYSGVSFLNPPNPPSILTLLIDPTTGQGQLKNTNAGDISLNAYRLTSTSGALKPSGWTPISGQSIPGFPAGNGSGNGWESPSSSSNAADYNGNGTVDAADYVLWRNNNINGATGYTDWRAAFGATGGGGGGTPNELVEWYLQGDSTLAAGASINLGQIFTPGSTQDVAFRYGEGTGVTAGTVMYGAIGSGTAVPEPTSACLILIAGGLAAGFVPRCRRTGVSKSICTLAVAGLIVGFVNSAAMAAVTSDRVYRLGDDASEHAVVNTAVGSGVGNVNPGSSLDSQGPGGSFQDLLALSNGGAVPNYADVASRPGAAAGALGIAFDGVDDYLSGFSLGFPPISRGTIHGGGIGTLNYDGIYQRGIQLWVNPTAGAAAAQHVVMDTTQHGLRITAGGNWSMVYNGAETNSNTAVSFGQWTHAMVAITDIASPNRAVLYINGVALAAGAANYNTSAVTNAQGLIVGANSDASGANVGKTNFFKGTLDELNMFVWGRSYDATTGAFADFGTFNFRTDNAYAATHLSPIFGDIAGTSGITQTDVNAFIGGWLHEKRVNNQRVGDINTYAAGDLNFDGITDLTDAGLFRQAMGLGSGAGLDLTAFNALVDGAVPEPSTLVLGMILAGWCCGCRGIRVRCNRTN